MLFISNLHKLAFQMARNCPIKTFGISNDPRTGRNSNQLIQDLKFLSELKAA